jgi:peptidoglycan/xylan/chitin deacetylase (PgdA/CDA1 family)
MLHMLTLLAIYFSLVSAYEGASNTLINQIINNPNSSEASAFTHCFTPGMIALTYDDGPNIFTKNFINNISSHYKVTFFVNGWNYEEVQASPWHEVIALANSKGHQIANHGWNHWSYTNASEMNSNKVKEDLDNADVLQQMISVNDLIYKIIGKAPRSFRPPYGQFNETTLELALIAGMDSMILWNIDSGDWELPNAYSVFEYIINITMAPGVSSKNSSFMIVMHEQIESSEIITTPLLSIVMKQLGYRFVTVAECIGIDGYQQNYTPTTDYVLYNEASNVNPYSMIYFLIISSMMYFF